MVGREIELKENTKERLNFKVAKENQFRIDKQNNKEKHFETISVSVEIRIENTQYAYEIEIHIFSIHITIKYK